MATALESFSTAVQLYEKGRFEQSEAICHELLQQHPQDVSVLRLQAVIARKTRREQFALQLLHRALQSAPQHPVLSFELASVYLQIGQPEQALEHYRRAAEADPQFQEAVLNVGGVLEQLERFDEALPWSRRAAELRPTCTLAHYNLGNVYRAQARIGEAIDCYAQAVRLDPNYAKAHWNLSLCYLLAGDFANGWREYEWRERAGEVFLDRYSQPRWDGSPLSGRTILVHAEQGVGDEVLFASCYPELLEQAERCIFVCDPRLEPLYRRSFPTATVHGYQRRKDWQPLAVPELFDCQIAAGSLPLYLRPDQNSFPGRRRFLMADPEQVIRWRERYEALGPELKIGISWRAGGKPAERRKRTTTLDEWQGLFQVPGVQWVNLQYGDATDEIAAVREDFGVVIHDWPEGDPLVDMDSFAAKVSALDLVISVGNATVHLAGALGVPAWTLLPLVPAWRWLIAGEDSPWYKSVRLYRQTDRSTWQGVFDRLENDLRALVNRGEPSRAIDGAHTGNNHQPRSTDVPAPEMNRNEDAPPVDGGLLFETIQDPVVLTQEAIPAAMATAVGHHQAGEYDQAESIYREVLRHAPRYADALHLLGVLARQTGRVELAVQSLRRAVAVAQFTPMFHFNLANALRDAGQLEEAIASYRRAIELEPQFADAHLNLGNCLRQTYQEDAALVHLQHAVRLHPGYAAAHNALAVLLLEEGRLDEALDQCQHAIAAQSDHAASHHNLGTVLRAMNRNQEASDALHRALALDPSRFETLANLANLLHELGQVAAAEQYYRQALALRADQAEVVNNLGMVLQEQGKFAESLRCYEQAIAQEPQGALAHANRALLNVQLQNFRAGWEEYEWRWHCQDGLRPRNYFRQPLWQGESLAGKTLLVHGEQGVGDEIMFATCLPDVIRQAKHCVIACDRRLARLFARSFPACTVHGVSRGREHLWQVPAEPAIDVQIPSGSLPRYLRLDLNSFPRQRQLLHPCPDRLAHWKQRFSALGPGLKIGISWQGGNKPEDRRQRWTSLDEWHGLLSVPGVHFISLQHGAPEQIQSELKKAKAAIATWSDVDPSDLDNLAARIAALDLVISVGNANIHLAGALGVPAWSLLPRYAGWRWLVDRSDTPWYASVRLFRQSRVGDWSELFQRVRAELLKKLASLHRPEIDQGN